MSEFGLKYRFCLFSQSIRNDFGSALPDVPEDPGRSQRVGLGGLSAELKGLASEKRGGAEAAWWFTLIEDDPCDLLGLDASSQVCRGAGRQMWGPLCPPRPMEGSEAAQCLSVYCVCVCCLDYYFGRRLMWRGSTHMRSQFAHWPRIYAFLLSGFVRSVLVMCGPACATLVNYQQLKKKKRKETLSTIITRRLTKPRTIPLKLYFYLIIMQIDKGCKCR